MAESVLDIEIVGNSQGAVQAFDSLDRSVANLGDRMHGLGETFQRPLEHVGVHLFGRELLTTMGLAGEARPVIRLLEVAVLSASEAFGIATGPIGLLIFGLGALAAIIYKVVEHHKAHKESLDKIIDTNRNAIKSNEDLLEKIHDYQTAVGHLTPEIEALRGATDRLTAAQRAQQEQTVSSQVAALKAHLQALGEERAALQQVLRVNEDLNKSYADGAEAHVVNTAAIGIERQRLHELNTERDKELQQLKSSEAELAALRRGYAGVVDQMEKETKAAKDATAAQKEFDKEVQKGFREMDRHREESLSKTMHFFGAQKDQAAVFSQAAGHAFNQVASNWSKNVSDMIFDGDRWRQSLGDILKDVVKMFFQAMLEMEIRYAAFAAFTGMGFGGGAAMGGAATRGMPGFSSAPMFATGFDGVFSEPTTIVVGDGGEPEHVKVTPQSRASGESARAGESGGGRSLVVNLTNNIYQANDPDAVGRAIVRRIRGLGEINFLRTA